MKVRNFLLIFLVIGLSSQTFAHSKLSKFGAKLCQSSSEYECVKVKRGQTWKQLFPDPDEQYIVKHVNRVNIPLHTGMVIAVPKDLDDIDKMDVAPFPATIPATGKKSIHFSHDKLAWGAYDVNGNLVNWAPASGGKNWCSDVNRRCRTVKGSFTVYRKSGSWCKSSKYPVGKGGAPMPYCMFFYRGFAIHGSPNVPGYHASHGCVRTFTSEAKWLNEEFTSKNSVYGSGPTKVYVE